MLDIQRYGLPNGDYTLDVSLRDVYSKGDTMSSSDDFTINFSDNEVEFSDIELLTNYEKADKDSPGIKNGYLLTPYVFNYYPETLSKVSFYAELYNTKKIIGSDPFLLTYYIRPFEIEKPLDKYIIRKRANAEDVNVVLGSFNIENLPSGNYLLVMEARNRNNEVIASKEVYFQRYNPDSNFNLNDMMVLNPQNTFVDKITNKDSMQMYIDYLSPISTEIERAYATGLIGSASLEELQKYFLNFWYERNSSDPEGEWNDYLVMVNHANEEFTSHRKLGYKSDRGRVFLQYGKPNVISDHHFEPAAYPYEIWHYYQLGNQRDKKFVFYAHDRGTNDFQLIHSNAIGELNNYRWQTVIYRRTWDPQSIDDSQIPDTWGGKATQSYRQPW
jgi:GWxTD domain-containing protein